MKKIMTMVLVSVALTGCATSNTLIDGLLGRYHNYDPVEYGQTVQLVQAARTLEAACEDRNLIQYKLYSMHNTVDQLRAYTEGRPYNSRLTQLSDTLIGMIQDTVKKQEMSEFFCRQRSRNIVKAAETIRALSGEKPE